MCVSVCVCVCVCVCERERGVEPAWKRPGGGAERAETSHHERSSKHDIFCICLLQHTKLLHHILTLTSELSCFFKALMSLTHPYVMIRQTSHNKYGRLGLIQMSQYQLINNCGVLITSSAQWKNPLGKFL